jgi:hypothetical protein
VDEAARLDAITKPNQLLAVPNDKAAVVRIGGQVAFSRSWPERLAWWS